MASRQRAWQIAHRRNGTCHSCRKPVAILVVLDGEKILDARKAAFCGKHLLARRAMYTRKGA